MSNSTLVSSSITAISGYEVSTIVLGVLFVTSEVLPFLRGRDKNNGILDTLICFLKGSSCVTGKIAETLEKVQEVKKDETKSDDVKLEV